MIRSTLHDCSLASLAFLGPTLASLAWPQLTRHSSRSRSVPAYPTLATLAWQCACCARSAAKGPARPSSFAGQARQPVRHLPGFARPVASCWPGQPGGQLRWPSGFGLVDYFLPGIPSGCTTLESMQRVLSTCCDSGIVMCIVCVGPGNSRSFRCRTWHECDNCTLCRRHFGFSAIVTQVVFVVI